MDIDFSRTMHFVANDEGELLDEWSVGPMVPFPVVGDAVILKGVPWLIELRIWGGDADIVFSCRRLREDEESEPIGFARQMSKPS